MLQLFNNFKSYLSKEWLKIKNPLLNDVICEFSYHIFIKKYHDLLDTNEINTVIFISEYNEKDSKYEFGSDFFLTHIFHRPAT